MAWASLSCLFNTTYVEIVIRDWCLRRSSPHSDTMYFEHEHFMVTTYMSVKAMLCAIVV